jgi:hypothetical protein
MKQRQAPITLKTLAAEDIYRLAKQFTHQHPRPKTTRGRKPLYPEALILTLALLQVAQQASYRPLLFGLAPQLLPTHALPALGTLLYRLQTLPEARWHALLTWLAKQGIALEQPAQSLEKPLVLVDGTGWGFDTPYYAQYRRGAAIRQMRSHGKGVILGYWRGGVVWLVGASLGDAYANEAHLMAEWLDRYGGAGGTGLPVPCGEALWVGDKLYGRQARLLERVEAVGWLPVVRVAPSLYQSVRAPSRLRALARLGEYGWALKERYRIEQVFGSVKSAYGSYIGCRRVAYVRVRVWGQLVLWNRVQYLRVGGGGIFLLCVGCGGCVMVVWWVEEEFSNTLRGQRGCSKIPLPATKPTPPPNTTQKNNLPQSATTAPYSTTLTDTTHDTSHNANPYTQDNSHRHASNAPTPALSDTAPATPNPTPSNDPTPANANAHESAEVNSAPLAPQATTPHAPHTPTSVPDAHKTYRLPTTHPTPHTLW